ncbi:MAG: hypothetical protein J0L99_14650 [Chitinophagales bacterium]|nr:hypothetical protein [Chitinophagales bacterium]
MQKTIPQLLILLFSCLPVCAQATIWYVNLNATGAQNGSSWADAFRLPTQALQAAQSGDEIWVAKGVYVSSFSEPYQEVILKSGVRLFGGFNGTEQQRDERNWQNNHTEIYAGSGRILCQYTGPGTLLDGFTVRKGVVDVFTGTGTGDCGPVEGPQYGCHGGGLYIYSDDSLNTTHIIIRNCTFKENRSLYGGGIAVKLLYGSADVEIVNCRFENNATNAFGGGIAIITGSTAYKRIRIDSCYFSENISNGTPFGGAPGLYILNDSPNILFELSHLKFINNRGDTWAGAYGVESYANRRIVLKNSIFDGNRVGLIQFIPGTGGAVAGFQMMFENCSFSNNLARWGGAADAAAVFKNCIFANNYAEKTGGALSPVKSMKIINSTFINNFAKESGGAILIYGGSNSKDTIINTLFFGNSTQLDKNNNIQLSLSTNNLYLKNCAFPFSNCDSIWLNGGYSTNPGVECHNNLYNLNPVFRDTANGDYRLAPCSPIRNQGDSAAVARYGLLHDLAGLPRVLNGLPDIGAYETPALEASYTQFPITCHNASDGILQFQDLGGFGPYGFSWSDNAGTLNREYLAPGQYRLSVSDINNCIDTLEFTFDNPPPFFVTAEKQDVDAIGASNGWAAISQITGGEAPYSVTWDNGDTTLRLENLPAGEYTAYVRDRRGCDTILTLVVGTTVADSNPQNEAIAAFFVPSPCKTCTLQPLRQGPDALEIPVSIYDLNGRLLYEYRGFVGNALPLPTQPPGLYVLRAGRQVLRYVQE